MTRAWGVRTIPANTNLTFGLPLLIWLLKGFYDNSPVEPKQAARIDGCARFRALWMIVMPPSMHRCLGPARVGW